jgi:hypothetical protein
MDFFRLSSRPGGVTTPAPLSEPGVRLLPHRAQALQRPVFRPSSSVGVRVSCRGQRSCGRSQDDTPWTSPTTIEVFIITWVEGICIPPDFDMAPDRHRGGPEQSEQGSLQLRKQHPLTGPTGDPAAKGPLDVADSREVLRLEPALSLAGVPPTRPAPETPEEFRIQLPEGTRRDQTPVEVDPALNPAIQFLDGLPRRRPGALPKEGPKAPHAESATTTQGRTSICETLQTEAPPDIPEGSRRQSVGHDPEAESQIVGVDSLLPLGGCQRKALRAGRLDTASAPSRTLAPLENVSGSLQEADVSWSKPVESCPSILGTSGALV